MHTFHQQFFEDFVNMQFFQILEMGNYRCPCCGEGNWAFLHSIKQVKELECMSCRIVMYPYGVYKLTMDDVVAAIQKEQI